MTRLPEPCLTFIAAQEELRRLGLTVAIVPGEYRVNFIGGVETTAYYTDDFDDALATGRAMAKAALNVLPPLGPTGRKSSRRAKMYRHNAKVAARRRSSTGG